MRSAVACAAALALGVATPLAAQAPRDALARGIQAYQALDYEDAASLLARALADDSANGLSPLDRLRALSYLGATELFRGNRDSAAALFRAGVLDDPRYRPDAVVFPPQVTDLFDTVRRATHAIAISVPSLTRLDGPGKRFTALVLTTTPQPVTVTVTAEDGTPVRTLYGGPIADTLSVVWDGAAADGTRVPDGRYRLRAAPGDSARFGRVVRSIPLEVQRAAVDTLPVPEPPADTVLMRASGRPFPLRSVAVGLVAGVTAVALPSIVASGAPVTGARFAVGGAIGIATLAGLFRSAGDRPRPASPEDHAAAHAAWQERADSLRTENAERRARAPLVIRAGSVGRRGEP